MQGVNQTLFPDPGRQALRLPVDLFLQIVPGPSTKWLVTSSLQPLATLLFGLATVVAVVLVIRSSHPRFAKILPLCCWVGAGQLRFFLPFAPFLYVLLGGGLARIERLRVVAAVVSLMLIFSMTATWWYYKPGMDKQAWKGVGEMIAREGRPGDMILVTEPHLLLPFRRAYRPSFGIELVGFPEVGTQLSADNLPILFVPLVRDSDRVWFVRMARTAQDSDLAIKWLEDNRRPVFRTIMRGYNGNIELFLFESRGARR
jgi:hypothetical protein